MTVENFRWPTRRLAEVCDVDPSSRGISDLPDDIEVSFIPMSAISEDGRLLLRLTKKLSNVRKGFTCFRDGDVLLAKITPCMENGKRWLARSLVNEIGFGSTEFHVLRPKSEVLSGWIFYFVSQRSFREDAAASMTGTAGQKRVPKQYLENSEIPVPPLELQRELVGVFEAVDGLRIKREHANQLASRMTLSVFLKMFGDPVSNENHWPVKTIREVAEKVSDGPFGSNLKTEHYTAEGVRVIRLQNIGVGEFLDDNKVFISSEHYSKLKKHTCVPRDVIVGTLGDPNLRACILPDYVKVAINKADCIQVRPNKNFVNAAYLCHLLNTPQMLRLASSYMHGETRTRISMSQVASLQIPIPPSSVQKTYAQIVQHIDHVYANQKRSSELIKELFHSLMQKAFKGELDLVKAGTLKDGSIEGSEEFLVS